MIKIQNISVDTPVLLAPMEDVTHQPFRRIVKRIGNPGLMFTEFVSAMAIHHGAQKTYKKMLIHPDERPVGIQIFGSEPDVMVETAQKAEEMGADLLDINMGCWVPKVCKTGSGAALLKDPILAEEIVKRVVRAVRIPVTVKVRAGWDYSLFAAPDLAKKFQDAGAQMITLHARFAKQGFDGTANWDLIRQLREAVQIPLIGNGDIRSPEDAENMMKLTGCDGVMIGRAAISNPWLVARICAHLENRPLPNEPTLKEKIDTALEHLELMIAYEAGVESFQDVLKLSVQDYQHIEIKAIRATRSWLSLYIKGEPGAAQLRKHLVSLNTYDEIRKLLLTYLEQSSLELLAT